MNTEYIKNLLLNRVCKDCIYYSHHVCSYMAEKSLINAALEKDVDMFLYNDVGYDDLLIEKGPLDGCEAWKSIYNKE